MPSPQVRTNPKAPHIWDSLPKPLRGLRAFLAGVVSTGLTTALAIAAEGALPVHGVAMIYILTVVASAVAFGVQSGIAAAVTAFLAYNFFFLQPLYTFSISDPRDLIALVVFFAVAIATGSLAGRLREVAEQARQKSRSLETLNALAVHLSAATSADAVAVTLSAEASTVSACPAVVLKVEASNLKNYVETPSAPPLGTADWQAARRCVATRQTIYPAAPGWQGQSYEFRAILVRGTCTNVLGIHRAVYDDAIDATLDAMVHQAQIAFERLSLAEEKAAAERAAEAERLRSALLSSISHDIKTPLASIQGAVTSMRELGAKMPEETKADLLIAIEEETTKLSRFVTNMLDMMRIQASPEVSRDWIDLADTIAVTVARARRIMPQAPIRLDVPVVSALVRGDETLIEHVLLNVIENAVHFAPAGAEVRVSLASKDTAYVVQVEDDGMGIAPEDLPRIFEKFYRGKGTKTHGSGLGLAICKDVMKALGGDISAESPVSDGRGTRITLEFPKDAEAP